MAPVTSALYEQDFVLWTEQMASLIESHQTDDLDWGNLAEEIRSLGISQQSAASSHLRVLLIHLIKWAIQPARRGRSWENSISNARDEIDHLVRKMPSLQRYLSEEFRPVFDRAAKRALFETRMPPTTPITAWSLDQVLDDTFFPE